VVSAAHRASDSDDVMELSDEDVKEFLVDALDDTIMPKEEVIRNLKHIQASLEFPHIKTNPTLGLAKSILVHAEKERHQMRPASDAGGSGAEAAAEQEKVLWVSDHLHLQKSMKASRGKSSLFLYHRTYEGEGGDLVKQKSIPGDTRGLWNPPPAICTDGYGVKKNSGVISKSEKISATKFMLFRELDGEIKTFGPALIITHHQIDKDNAWTKRPEKRPEMRVQKAEEEAHHLASKKSKTRGISGEQAKQEDGEEDSSPRGGEMEECSSEDSWDMLENASEDSSSISAESEPCCPPPLSVLCVNISKDEASAKEISTVKGAVDSKTLLTFDVREADNSVKDVKAALEKKAPYNWIYLCSSYDIFPINDEASDSNEAYEVFVCRVSNMESP